MNRILTLLAYIFIILLQGCAHERIQMAYTAIPVTKQNSVQEIKPFDSKLTTHLQEEVNIGLVKINIYNFCLPMLDRCESWVVLNYRGQTLKKERMDVHRLTKEDISQKGDFITVKTSTGGNCFACDGFYVFKIENDRLYLLGYFIDIDKNYLVGIYDVLEINDITYHIESPSWAIYYKNKEGSISLDYNKTCDLSSNRQKYEKDKVVLLTGLKTEKNSSNINNGLLLFVLSYSKWCGLKGDYLEVVTSIKESGLFDYKKIDNLNKVLNEVIEKDDSSVLDTIRENI